MSEAYSKNPQYSIILGLERLKRRNDDAQGTETVREWQRMIPPAAGVPSGILTKKSLDLAWNSVRMDSIQSLEWTGDPRSLMFSANTG